MSGRARSMSSTFVIFSQQKLSSVPSGCATALVQSKPLCTNEWHRAHSVISYKQQWRFRVVLSFLLFVSPAAAAQVNPQALVSRDG